MQDDDENEGSGTPPLELAKSYLAYGVRALRLHRLLAAVIAATVVAATVIAVIVWPRSYTCVTVLAAQDGRVLDGDKSGGSLGGATEVITSSENVAAIVDELKLTKSWEANLPPMGRLKQAVRKLIRGEVSESAKRDALVAMVQSNLHVTPPGWNESKLVISADWGDAKTAAALADAAYQSFLRARHVAEISTITEYITILEGHANELRDEIKGMASQGKTDTKADPVKPAPGPDTAPATPAAPVVRKVVPTAPSAPVEDLTELRATVAEKQAALKAIEDGKSRRIAEAEQTLTELRSKFTPAHPMVVTAERNLANLSQDSPQVIALRGEVNDLSSKLKAKTAIQKEEAAFRSGRGVVPLAAGATPGASSVEPLPADIMRLMQEDSEDLDPAVSAQFRTAVAKYATLRDKIGTARVDLDTAQAAFKHRYRIVIPAEVPSKPSKPKVPVVLGAGLLMSLFLAWLAAVISELRSGKLVERWQVDSLGVPLLGDVRWPPASGG
jgi:uncharacterized protein involved in exopolysaccharide biosynthesis